MTKTVLDLFCGAGGAAVGYNKAGFDVLGVDNAKQKHYPFVMMQMDWRQGLEEFSAYADLIHASPPCQGYSRMINPSMGRGNHPILIREVREALQQLGKPYVIEAVLPFIVRKPYMLCGQQFGIRVIRHRYFETSFDLVHLPHEKHVDYVAFGKGRDGAFRDAMECMWMNTYEARQAIPPRYTEWIGRMSGI